MKKRIVIRNIPPNIDESTFKPIIEPYIANINYWYYVQGKHSAETHIDARAYLDFKDPNHVYEFVAHFEKTSFLDNRGVNIHPRVEYAPYQIELKQKKPDNRAGTIDTDEDFTKFVEELNNPTAKIEEEKKPTSQPTSTPLLDAIRKEYENKQKNKQKRSRRKPKGPKQNPKEKKTTWKPKT